MFTRFFDVFVYSSGEMMDLNDLIDPALGIMLFEARGIHDHGQIVVNGGRGSSRTRDTFTAEIA